METTAADEGGGGLASGLQAISTFFAPLPQSWRMGGADPGSAAEGSSSSNGGGGGGGGGGEDAVGSNGAEAGVKAVAEEMPVHVSSSSSSHSTTDASAAARYPRTSSSCEASTSTPRSSNTAPSKGSGIGTRQCRPGCLPQAAKQRAGPR